MLTFDTAFKEALYRDADHASRKRAHRQIHPEASDAVQRIAIALRQGTYIPPHRHPQPHAWEFIHVTDGSVKLILFTADGEVDKVMLLGPPHDAFAVQLPPNTLHTLVCLSEHALFFEVKQGPYDPATAKAGVTWAPEEGDEQVAAYLARLTDATTGQLLTL